MYCPRCQRTYGPGIRVCPECEVSLEREEAASQELVSVLEPEDQLTAMAAVARLEEHGIRAVAKSEQIAMYDGLAMMMRLRWGKVLVLEKDRARAREILEEFQDQRTEEETDSEKGED